ncbi:MAG TPA: helix-turn-helix transcriptional regulator [Blastocatellia bacterium]|nr:helix-turn-helix transcriptional regulator [Blastocatellia bacterium]
MGKQARIKQVRLGEKLLMIRQALGLSQNELIRYLNLSDEIDRGTLSNYEHGDREPALYVILRYAKAAEISTDVLIDDDLDLPNKLPTLSSRNKPLAIKTTLKRTRK